MNCLQCGNPLRVDRENFLYDACGLPGVTLLDVEVDRCPSCGAYEVVIPQLEELHALIARLVTRKAGRLTGPEVRFLRKWLGWSGADFAAHMGVAPETASRWETGADPIGTIADRLLRLMVMTKPPVQDYSLELLKNVAREDSKPVRLGLQADESGWHARAA